jgi:hypothetical protein
MVTHYTYEITLLVDADFQRCPKFLLYQKLMREIKRLTCLRSERVCRNCPLKAQCIYDKLSGENFHFFPAIIIKRNIAEPMKYSSRSKFQIELFLLGNAAFRGYIESFFEHLKEINKQYVMVQNVGKEILESQRLEDRKYRIMTPFKETDISTQLAYYLDRYKCRFEPTTINHIQKKRKVYDKTSYRLDNRHIRINGVLGDVVFESIDALLVEIGIGQTNFIGGGTLHALED